MAELKRVVKNSTFIFLTNLFGKILTLVLIIILARYLGVQDYGKFSFVISFVGLFAVFGNFGLGLLLKRLVSRNKKKVNYYFSNAIIISGLFNFLTFLTIILFANILRYDRSVIGLIIVGALFVVFQNLKSPFQSVYEAFEKMQYVFWTRITKIVFRLLLVLLFIFLERGILEILLVYAFVEIVMVLINLWIYNRYIGKISFKPDKKSWWKLIKQAAPFGVAGVFMTIYDKIDVTMLSKMVPSPDLYIGYYSSAYELMSSLGFIAMSISGALAPIAFRAFVNNKAKLKRIFKDTFKIFMSLAVPICIGGVLLAQQIVFLIYGNDFSGAVIAFQILVWAVIFNFEMFALGLALNSMNLEKETMKATILSVIFNIVANIILIPIYGYLAAAITTVGSVLVYFIYCFRVTQRRLVKINLFKMLIPIVASSIAMGVIIYFLKDLLHVVILIPIGFLVYAGFLFLTKGVDMKLIKSVLDALKK